MAVKGAYILVLLIETMLGAAHNQELRYALFTSGPTGGFDTSGVVPAIELAEELINADSSILPGYNLTHTSVVDTMCDRTVSLNEYFDAISPPHPTVLGLLGCGCSVASTPVAEIIHHNSISQISYASSLSELSNRDSFPNFFRTYPSDTIFTPAIVSLIQEYGWKRIAFITQDENLFTETLAQVQDPLEEAGIEVANRMISSPLLMTGLGANFFFENEDYRVFFVNAYSTTGKQIICQAYLRGYTYPKYAWLTYGWYQDRWWTEEVNPEPTNCTDDQLAEALHRSIALQLLPNLNKLNSTTDTGLTPREFDSLYKRRLANNTQDNYTYTFFATVAYDALWTFAIALNKTNEMVRGLTREEILNMTQCGGTVEETGVEWEVVSLENFTYSNQLMGCIIRWNLAKTNFIGVSGPVQFDNDGSRVVNIVEIFQYRLIINESAVISRVYFSFTQNINDSHAEFFYKSGESNITVFPSFEGGVPPDGRPVPQFITYNLALVIPYYILAAIGLVFCTVCLLFNFTQRKKRVVKLTSPNINYFIIVGAYCNYISIYLRVLPSTDYTVTFVRCFINSTINTIGISLAFSAILVKMGRVYYIFHNPSLGKKTLNDWKLVLIVMGISGIGVVLAVLQVTVPQLQPIPDALNVTTDTFSRNEFDERTSEMVYQCYTESVQTIYLTLTIVYLAILQIIGIVLAIQTRKVKIKLLNDSKYISAVIYISSISLFFVGSIVLIPDHLINIEEAIFSGSILIATTFFLVLIFIPKMISLYRDPEGNFVLNQTNNSVQTNGTSVNLVSGDATTQMKERIAKLETLLKNDNTLTCPTCHSDYLSNGQNCSKTDNETMTDFKDDTSLLI
ncbi:gamma-aminobutyric acid type B receptor subunit 2-like [Halichondria panicea]|uniref:gamma-aminobutyric acid type B receptor subunit 2-like n=1 Tax=Halichondria panicea TaxID=6063 RepID=UPI00312B5A21